MKKTLLSILALTLCVGAFAQAITPDPKPAAKLTPAPVTSIKSDAPEKGWTVDDYNKLKADLATAQQQGAVAVQWQQLAEYRGVLAERNQLGIQLLQTQAQLSDVTAKLNDANKEIQSLRDKLAAHEKDSPKK